MIKSVYKIAGIKTNALTISELNNLVSISIKTCQKWIIANHNLHSVYLYNRDEMMRSFYAKADYIHIDGMSLVLLGRFLGYPLKQEQRVTYADWIWPLIADAEKYNWRIFYLGSKPGVAAKGAEILVNKYPKLQISTGHGYFDWTQDSDENREVVNIINAYQPHILMVGMGMPRQEHWILENLDHIKANVILPSGACLDYVAGAVPTPPRWMGHFGLEWLYRLGSEPSRLWRRYLVEPWFVFRLFIQDIL